MGKLKQPKSCFSISIRHISLLMKRLNSKIVLTTCDHFFTRLQELPPRWRNTQSGGRSENY